MNTPCDTVLRALKPTVVGVAMFCAALFGPSIAAGAETLLLRDPAISERHVAFIYAGDLWVADRNGANARRLTSSLQEETNPVFSPDGSMIAYSANVENNIDVYVISTAGGQPRRLTFHPGEDIAVDWRRDGAAVLLTSRRETNAGRAAQLFEVSLKGGLPRKRMEARIFRGQFNADGSRLAYIPFGPAYNGLYGGTSGWRGYRGGTTPSIHILDTQANRLSVVPGERVNDIEPMWVGEMVYFVSDRDNKVFNLHRFDPATGAVVKVSDETTWDIRAAGAHGDTIIYEAGGRLKLFDTRSGQVDALAISITPDLPQRRPQWKDASKTIESFDLSPNGLRALITARGEVFSVPVKDGSTRNLTATPGAREYSALWSPDGKQIAFIDAANEEQALVIRDQTGLGAARRIKLGPDFQRLLAWGGDGRHIAYQNHKLELFVVNTESGAIRRVAKAARRASFDVAFSPDGRWLAYTDKQLNFNRQLKLYELASAKSHPVGDALADASSPAFSPDGKYLYFAASTNAGPQQVFLDMSSQELPYRAGLYAVILAAEGVSPVKPPSGDEGEAKKDGPSETGKQKDDKGRATRIDIGAIANRIVALPVAERNYSHLSVAKDGTLYFLQSVQPGAANTPPEQRAEQENALLRFKFDERKTETVLSGATAAAISASGEHLIVRMSDGALHTAKIAEKIEAKPLKVADMRVLVDPAQEWVQIFDEAWRMERAFFYDPAMHGLDWQGVYNRYRPLLAHVGRREDLNALLVEMIAEMHAGHNRVGGGDVHRDQGPPVGLLGADFAIENGRHRIRRIYTGEAWNPFLVGPLAEPGLGVNVGDYILAVNGRPLGPDTNIFEHLQGTVGKQIALQVSSRPDATGARTITVTPIANEAQLRLWAWVESNRKEVEAASGGRIGYVYLPNTAGAGFTFFNRMFFAQVDKDAMIIDERANGGGQAANYITDVLSRTYLSGWKDFAGAPFNTPGGAMYGPKVMLIDQDAGSGGDFLPYAFRTMNIGPLIGTRTWGGLIGISVNPSLIDGGSLTVPYFRFFDVDYRWSVENEGVAPDIEVALDPLAANAGRDTQLERAIAEARRLLDARPSRIPRAAPAYPTELGQ